MRQAIHWFSKNHVTANFLMALLILAGFATWFKIRKEVFPNISLDAVMIQVPFPNATPEEVEDGILLPIEDAIADVDGIKRVTASAMQSIGAVTVEVETGYDVRDVMDDLKTKVDAISNFPVNAEKPVLEEARLDMQVMSIAVSADVDEKTLREIGETVRDGLLDYQPADPPAGVGGSKEKLLRMIRGVPRITKVTLAAVRPYEISIEVSEKTLRSHNLTLAQVAEAVRQTSLDLPSGSIRTKAGEVVIRAKGKRYTSKEFEDVVVTTRPDGSQLLLREIATIVDGFEDVDLSSRFDGRRAVLINVFRTGEQDTLMMADAVRDYVEHVAPSQLPEGVHLELWNDASKILEGRLSLLIRNGTTGLILVFVVLALFLRPSLAFLVALGIPVSFAGGLWMMPELDVSVNMITLFAFILVLGIVVDDAIVVGENVYSRIQAGEHPREASWRGTHEVGTVVIFGVLTTVAAFTPMLGISGVSGKIWPNIPLVVIPTLLFSLVQSKLVLPAHLALLRPHDHSKEVNILFRVQRRVAKGLEQFVEKVYQPALHRCLEHRYAVWSVFIALLLLVSGLVVGKWVPFEFMPKVEGDVVTAKFELPVGVPFELTEEEIQKIAKAAEKVGQRHKDHFGNPIAVHILANAGSQPFQTGFGGVATPLGSHLGEVTVELSPAADRDLSADGFINEWREEIGKIPGLVELSFKQETSAGGNAIDIEISGRNSETLEEAARYITTELAEYTGVKDISTDSRRGKRELVYDELTPAGKAMGFSLQSVAVQIRHSFYGEEVQRIQRGRDELKVMVRYPKSERRSLENLEDVRLRTLALDEVPLAEVASARPERGPATIHRVDRKRAIKISADVDRTVANANEVVGRFNEEVLDDLATRFPGVKWDYLGEQKDQSDSLSEMGTKFIFALLGIYVLMAIPLKSYIQPVIVMSVIPFGMVGAVAGHIFMGMDLSIMSMLGIIALAGVVVNDSLVLVEYVNRHREDEKSLIVAVRRAGAARFRPILLTSLTTFAGLMPMLLETDMQARFLIPMAVSLGFGILFATTITLLLVPSVYMMLEDLKSISSKKRGS
ncbi:efflux RND transporter permease subunit [Verrucomicrobiaceae bacterium N1E253]|uniref:Efflux RND transporter permease subunit n=1 Tax=Oceaniferula marina TaxID=2748318 RepID=A0A851GBK8_9BACT|nr:efflux RND transporter permease subunit [Oceaniferula marina]NWK54559.1 efflux RND transporter permease subunit [Oceaniferula marina]